MRSLPPVLNPRVRRHWPRLSPGCSPSRPKRVPRVLRSWPPRSDGPWPMRTRPGTCPCSTGPPASSIRARRRKRKARGPGGSGTGSAAPTRTPPAPGPVQAHSRSPRAAPPCPGHVARMEAQAILAARPGAPPTGAPRDLWRRGAAGVSSCWPWFAGLEPGLSRSPEASASMRVPSRALHTWRGRRRPTKLPRPERPLLPRAASAGEESHDHSLEAGPPLHAAHSRGAARWPSARRPPSSPARVRRCARAPALSHRPPWRR